MAKKVKAPKTGLTTKHWFGYMFGDWGGCMTFALMGSLFTMYCTNALGFDPTLLGTLVIIWTIWDAINDPMMGALMDKLSQESRISAASSAPGCSVQLPWSALLPSLCGLFPLSVRASR